MCILMFQKRNTWNIQLLKVKESQNTVSLILWELIIIQRKIETTEESGI